MLNRKGGIACDLGYVPCTEVGESRDSMLASTYQLEVAGRIVEAEASLKPMYDLRSERVKA